MVRALFPALAAAVGLVLPFVVSPAPIKTVQAASQPSTTITVEGRREPGEASVSTKAMRYLPFEVPKGVTRITIHRDYDHGPDAKRKNTVDFGLFDQSGTEKGFRGWQGGSPGDFVITGDAVSCSPHAIPGPLPSGRWYIAQYYLVSAPAGLNYKYTVTFDFDGSAPPRSIPSPPPYNPGVLRTGPGWFAGNLHAHSLHSDGGRTFSEMIGRCATNGFDFVASTEHNTTTAHYRFPEAAREHPDVLLLYGDEFTSPGGHANIIGQTPGHWFDFRMDPGDRRLPGVIKEAHKEGAILTVNHPYAECMSCTWKYSVEEWKDADAIEVWNGIWTPEDRRAIEEWDSLLKAGRKIHGFGGTDYHRGEDALVPATLVYAQNLSQSTIMDGLRKGHAYISESPRGPKLLLSNADNTLLPGDTLVSPVDKPVEVQVRIVGGKGMTLQLIWADGKANLPVSEDEETLHYTVPSPQSGATSYIRAELLHPGGTPAALTNPLFITTKK